MKAGGLGKLFMGHPSALRSLPDCYHFLLQPVFIVKVCAIFPGVK